MAYRRRQGITRASTFKEEIYQRMNTTADDDDVDDFHQNNYNNNNNSNNDGSLAAKAIRASAAHRDSSAYGYAYAGADHHHQQQTTSSFSHSPLRSLSKGTSPSESTSIKDMNDPKYGFWGILARKAKSILDENDQYESSNKMKPQVNDTPTGNQFYQSRQSSEGGARMDNTRLRKGLDAITSSLNHLGDTLGNAFEGGRTIVEHKTADIIQETRNKTADIIQETRKLQLRRRGGSSDTQDQATVLQNSSWQRPVIQPVQTDTLANQETQLKASRDVAMATAAKAKVLLRELKTVKADLAFAKERCAQLEEENKRLRESREKGDYPADDDLIRLQLETLLAEKARLAHESSIYARENRFLREIVEYHQLTMQDVVYLDEGAEEVTEVYPFSIDDAKVLSSTPTSPMSPPFLPDVSPLSCPPQTQDAPKEASNTATSSITPSLPSEASPNCSVERKEYSEVPNSSQTVGEEDREASARTEPPSSVGEDPKGPSI